MSKVEFIEGIHYYMEDGKLVMLEQYHINRGFCCGKKCRHCPYVESIKGTTELKPMEKKD